MDILNTNLNAMDSSATYTTKVSSPKTEITGVGKGSSDSDIQFNGYISRGMKKVIQDRIDIANTMLRQKETKCEYRYVEEARRIAIKVVDTDTDQVIKEIPSEDILKMAEQIEKMTGLLIDERS